MDQPSSNRVAEGASALESQKLFRFPKPTFIALGSLALVWQVASYFAPAFAIPGFERIFAALVTLEMDFVVVTVARVLGAMAVSFVLGLGVAILMYWFKRVEDYGLPLVRFLMAVPAVCWVVFAILWFKWVEFRILFVLFIVCGPVFVIDILDGMKGIPVDLRQMLRSFRPTAVQTFVKLVIPGTLPIILTSWKINLTLAIRVVTIAELVGAVTGIGYGLVVAQELFSIAEVFAWTIVLVVILFALQSVVDLLEKRWLRWRV